jgi:signal transduction histidine kinase
MDLGKLLANRTRRLGLTVALALGLCLVLLAFLNTQAQERQNKKLIEAAAHAALALARHSPGLDQADHLSQAVISKVTRDTERLTLNHELRENAVMAVVSFVAFVAFATLLIALEKRTIRSALAPVQSMVKELEAFEAGDLSRRMPQIPLQELDSVARSFNHLADSLQASISSQEQLSRQLIEMRHQERLSLARDLHDDLGQTLTAAAIEIEAARLLTDPLRANPSNFEKIESSLDRARQSLRQLTMTLRGEKSGHPGQDFTALLTFWKTLHPEVHWQLGASLFQQLEGLGASEKPVIFRILQESLTNVFKHSQPTECSITLLTQFKEPTREIPGRTIRILLVRNNGVKAEPAFHQGFGLEGMRERALSISANLQTGLEQDGWWQVSMEWH